MKLYNIIQNEQLITKLFQTLLPNAKLALQWRKTLKSYLSHIEEFNLLKVDKIKSYNKQEILPQDPEYQEVVDYLNKVVNEEIIIDTQSISAEDLGSIQLSPADIDNLILIGLIKDE